MKMGQFARRIPATPYRWFGCNPESFLFYRLVLRIRATEFPAHRQIVAFSLARKVGSGISTVVFTTPVSHIYGSGSLRFPHYTRTDSPWIGINSGIPKQKSPGVLALTSPGAAK